MAYMAGNLTRRFRSGRASSRKCPSSQSCVVEVVTSNFDEIVLDETKVGGLEAKDTPPPPPISPPTPQVTNVGLNLSSIVAFAVCTSTYY